MLSGVSNFIKKNLSLKQESSDSGNQAQRPGDRVEDGFLLVGDSASERNTVYTNSYRANQAELPPGYSEVSQNGQLPSYTDYQKQSQFYSPTVDNSNFQYGNPFQTGMPTTQTGTPYQNPTPTNSSTGASNGGEASYKSAIADVPFALGATSNVYSSISELKTSDLLRQRTFDYNCYEYDFSLEMRFLAEHGEFNNADMDWQG